MKKKIQILKFSIIIVLAIGFILGLCINNKIKADNNIANQYKDIVVLKNINSYLKAQNYKSTLNKDLKSIYAKNKQNAIAITPYNLTSYKKLFKTIKDFLNIETFKTKQYEGRIFIYENNIVVLSHIYPNLMYTANININNKNKPEEIKTNQKILLTNVANKSKLTDKDTPKLVKEAMHSKVMLSILLFFCLFMITYLWARACIFKKAGYKRYYTLIPLYSDYLLSKIAFNNGYLFLFKLLVFIPVIGSFAFVIFIGIEGCSLCEKFNKSRNYKIAMILGLLFFGILYIVLFLKLAFDSSKYKGETLENRS